MESVLYGSKQGGGWTVEQRCLGWLQVLSSSTSSSPDATALPPLPRHLFQLAAVLLRRDIIHLPNINTNNTASRLVEPLLQILSDHQHSLEGAPTATAIAPATATAIAPLYHCLAEICACLNWQRPDSVDASSTTNNNNSTGSGSSVAVATVQRILSVRNQFCSAVPFPCCLCLFRSCFDRIRKLFYQRATLYPSKQW